MTDVTSEKLYEKLDRINNVKRNLKKVMIDIGGYELFQNDPKFETYPEILCTIQDRIEAVNRLLDITVYGKELNNVFTTADITYKKIIPYIEEAQSCRMALIDNLNTKGVIADTDETLRSLVGKVLDIKSGGGKVPFEETLLTYSLGDLDFKLVLIGSYSGNEWYEELMLYVLNNSDEIITLEDPFYYVTISNYDYSLSYSCICYSKYPIYSHSYYSFFVISNWGDTTEIDQFADSIRENGAHLSYEEIYASENRRATIPFGDYGAITFMLAKINNYTYYINYDEYPNGGNPAYIDDGNYYFRMKDGNNSYTFADWYQDSYFYGGNYANVINIYSSSDVEFFSDYLTNNILIEMEDTRTEEVLYSVNLPNALLEIVGQSRYEYGDLWKSLIYRVNNNSGETINLENPAYFIQTVIDPEGENIGMDTNLVSYTDISDGGHYDFYVMNTDDPESIEYYNELVQLIKDYGLTFTYTPYYPQEDGATGTIYLPQDNNFYINYLCCPINENSLYVRYTLGNESGSSDIVLDTNYHLRMTDPNNGCVINLSYFNSGEWWWEGSGSYVLNFYDEDEMECIANCQSNVYSLDEIHEPFTETFATSELDENLNLTVDYMGYFDDNDNWNEDIVCYAENTGDSAITITDPFYGVYLSNNINDSYNIFFDVSTRLYGPIQPGEIRAVYSINSSFHGFDRIRKTVNYYKQDPILNIYPFTEANKKVGTYTLVEDTRYGKTINIYPTNDGILYYDISESTHPSGSNYIDITHDYVYKLVHEGTGNYCVLDRKNKETHANWNGTSYNISCTNTSSTGAAYCIANIDECVFQLDVSE